MTQEELFKKLVAHCKEYGFIFPSSEIYDGLSAVYDYGQMGVELKNNIKRYWWDSMTKLHDNIVGIDAAIFMHPRVWEASGHVGAFNDPLIDNKDSKKRYRADVLIEDWIAKQDEKIDKEVEKGRKRFGERFDEEQFRATNPRVAEITAKRNEINTRMAQALNANDLDGLRQIIIDTEIACPISGTRNWTEVRQFNLMFDTKIGSVADGASTIYLRPETAQGIFVNFLNVQKTGRMKIPFGIAQIGKAFRNEIVARQFIFRMREFEQMEMQFFVRPGEELAWFAKWKEARMRWHRALGFGDDNYRFHDHEKLAHYANAAADMTPLPVWFQGGGGRTLPHRLRPRPARRVLRQEDTLLRRGDGRKLYPLCNRDLHRRRPHGIAGTFGGISGGEAGERRRTHGTLHSRPARTGEGSRVAARQKRRPAGNRPPHQEHAQIRLQTYSTTRRTASASVTAARMPSAPRSASR